jgi:hypothetical protein
MKKLLALLVALAPCAFGYTNAPISALTYKAVNGTNVLLTSTNSMRASNAWNFTGGIKTNGADLASGGASTNVPAFVADNLTTTVIRGNGVMTITNFDGINIGSSDVINLGGGSGLLSVDAAGDIQVVSDVISLFSPTLNLGPGGTNAVRAAIIQPQYAQIYHLTNGMTVTNANTWVRWPHLTNQAVIAGVTMNTTGGVTVAISGDYHVSGSVSGSWPSSLFSWAIATNGIPVEHTKVGRLLGSTATVTLQPDGIVTLEAGSRVDLVLQNVNSSTAITNNVSRLQIFRIGP